MTIGMKDAIRLALYLAAIEWLLSSKHWRITNWLLDKWSDNGTV